MTIKRAVANRTILAVLAVSSCFSASAQTGNLSAVIQKFTSAPEYRHASWGIAVADQKTGEVLYSQNADKLFAPASTTKLFSSAAALMDIGPAFRFVTPVYLVPSDGAATLVLRAVGDPNLSGRIDANGHLAFTNEDHIYAGFDEHASVTPTDPLSGLDDLAKQVREAGISRVADVVIDDRFFDVAEGSGSGPSRITPVVVNDNILDVMVAPTTVGSPAKVEIRPKTSYARWDISVQTVEAHGKTQLSVEEVAPHAFAVRGQIAAGHLPVLGIALVNDPAQFARTLLIERLQAQGVTVDASALAEVNPGKLPSISDYDHLQVVARHTSPPFSETLKVILKTSHNLSAGMLPLLIATHHHERNHQQGMLWEGKLLKQLGMDTGGVSFTGPIGGGRSDFVTPSAVVSLLRAMSQRSDFAIYRDSLPVLGVDGTLAESVPASSPVRGHVSAKTGTLLWENALNGEFLLLSKALSGYMTAHSGRELIVALYVNNVPIATPSDTRTQGNALGRLCELIYQAF